MMTNQTAIASLRSNASLKSLAEAASVDVERAVRTMSDLRKADPMNANRFDGDVDRATRKWLDLKTISDHLTRLAGD